MQVFYAMCQGLLYAFCYHLDSLLNTTDDMGALDPSQLQSVHISDTPPPAELPAQDQSCMQAAEIREKLADLLPGVLHHRYHTHASLAYISLLSSLWHKLCLLCITGSSCTPVAILACTFMRCQQLTACHCLFALYVTWCQNPAARGVVADVGEVLLLAV